MDINKSEKVTLTYKDGKIKVLGTKIKAVCEISSSELRNMYFGKKGEGTLHLQLLSEDSE
jgi:hypothetical protein